MEGRTPDGTSLELRYGRLGGYHRSMRVRSFEKFVFLGLSLVACGRSHEAFDAAASDGAVDEPAASAICEASYAFKRNEAHDVCLVEALRTTAGDIGCDSALDFCLEHLTSPEDAQRICRSIRFRCADPRAALDECVDQHRMLFDDANANGCSPAEGWVTLDICSRWLRCIE